MYSLPESVCFDTADRLLESVKADAVLVASPDAEHFGHIMAALDRDWNILTEKPVTAAPEELDRIEDRLTKGDALFMICHVLRHSPFFSAIKDLLEEGSIGKLMCVQHNENVGHFHMAHSFVRGNWRNRAESSPMILAKCCHDMDILNWLVDDDCTRVQSFGGLGHFRKENSPAGVPDR